jgi:hypothetical protein
VYDAVEKMKGNGGIVTLHVRPLNECNRVHALDRTHAEVCTVCDGALVRPWVHSIVLVQMCVCILGIYARANMSELEHRLVSGIKRTICALEPSVQK